MDGETLWRRGLANVATMLMLASACWGTAPRAVASEEFADATTAFAPVAPVAPADLLADVAILERAYRELHPGLLRYLTPRQLDAAFAELRQGFDRPRTVPEAYLAFARLAAKIRCGHTYANFYSQSKAVQARLFDSTPRLPFYFRWIGGTMVVTRDFGPGSTSISMPRASATRRPSSSICAATRVATMSATRS